MKKIFSVVLVVALMSSIFYGCGVKPEEESGNSASAETDATNEASNDDANTDSQEETHLLDCNGSL